MVVAAMDDDDVHDRGNVSTNESLLNFRMFFFQKRIKKCKNYKKNFKRIYFHVFIFQ